METKIINIFGNPGSGKSTIAAYLFTELKSRNIEVELVTETAKDLVYIAKLNKNNDLYKLAMYGYKMTAAGKNPGLDGK